MIGPCDGTRVRRVEEKLASGWAGKEALTDTVGTGLGPSQGGDLRPTVASGAGRKSGILPRDLQCASREFKSKC